MEIIEHHKIKFWLHRILSEKVTDLKNLSQEIAILNHQAENWDKLQERYKNEVIKEMNANFVHYNWNYMIVEAEE